MKQIFDRIKRIAKSYAINDAPRSPLIGENDDLKRIIDELNSEPKHKESRRESKSEKEKPRDSDKIDFARACEILEVATNATPEEIKKAYKSKILQYHPDKVENLGEEIKEVAKRKTLQINKAYELLKTEKGFK